MSTNLKSVAIILLMVWAAQVASAQGTSQAPAQTPDCMGCHDKSISSHAFNASVHQTIKCTACHVPSAGAKALAAPGNPKACVVSFKPINCSSCHATITNEHANSIHNSQRLPVPCWKCHADIHTITSIKNNKIAAARLCSQCHEKEADYFKSIHFMALAKGNNDAPACTDCHGLHAINRIDNISQGRSFHTQTCLKCHSDEAKMARHKVTAIAPETYFESYHGKNVRLGYPEKVAGCADCHNSHYILPAKDTNSSVNPLHLQHTCGQCHIHASTKFAKFIPHAEPTNHRKYPLLFWVTISMNLLLAGTFLFFWIHSLLWAFRGHVEMKQIRNAAFFNGDKQSQHAATKIKKKVYRRFKTKHIILHLFVVSSFLGLAVTGLPLKFNYTEWGKAIMDFIGGVETAGIIHRICAIITFGYFIVTLVMSTRFLFSKKYPGETFGQRLFGPDSLFPNRKDFRDIKAMFRWFFFRGPKPAFDRWTYWEKFDFLAVFWGVAVIGSSGLILWFPEFFGHFLPGWVFNAATIIHSDEALLAVGFIFTIHFFNTHFRAEKFPMDFVIFNGQVTEEEMIHERSQQWERYQSEGITEEFEVKKPAPVAWDIALRIFGLLALLTGVVLALLILYTIIW